MMSTPPPIELATAALQDKTLSAKALASTIIAQCRHTVQLAAASDETSGGRKEDGDTLGLEGYLWTIWFALADVAMEDPSRHDFFANVLVAIKANENENGEWQIWSESFNWADLPLWGATVAETMHRGAWNRLPPAVSLARSMSADALTNRSDPGRRRRRKEDMAIR